MPVGVFVGVRQSPIRTLEAMQDRAIEVDAWEALGL